jgi:hypothetical protein
MSTLNTTVSYIRSPFIVCLLTPACTVATVHQSDNFSIKIPTRTSLLSFFLCSESQANKRPASAKDCDSQEDYSLVRFQVLVAAIRMTTGVSAPETSVNFYESSSFRSLLYV